MVEKRSSRRTWCSRLTVIRPWSDTVLGKANPNDLLDMSQSSSAFPHEQQPMANTSGKKADLNQPELPNINSSDMDLAFELLNTDYWEKKIEGMDIINNILQTKPDILIARLHHFCISLSIEITHMRTLVSWKAAFTMGNMYTHFKKNMDQELERTAKALLQAVGNPSPSLRQDVDVALDSMVRNCSVPFVFKALHSGGLRHKAAAVRTCASQHLFTLVQRIDAADLLWDIYGILNSLLPIAAQLAWDASQEVRHFGRQVLIFMAPHPGFDEALQEYLPAKDMSSVKDIVKKAQEPPKMQTESTMPRNEGPMACHGVGLTAAQGKQHSTGQEEQHIGAKKSGTIDADIFCHDEQQPMANTSGKKADLNQPELPNINSSDMDLAFELLNTDYWEKKIEGMDIINNILQTEPDILIARLHHFCISLSNEITNMRTRVSRKAAFTMGNMYTHFKKNMDQELERTAEALLQAVGNPSPSLRQDIDVALDSMVRNCSVPFVFKALHSGGLRHRVAAVRTCASQHLFTLVQRIDTADLLSDTNGILNRLLPIAAQLAQDASQEVRHFGRQVLIFMAPHPGFDEALQEYLPAKAMSSVKDIVKKAQEPPKMQMRSTMPRNEGPMASHGMGLTAAQGKQHSMGQEEQHIGAKESPKTQMTSTASGNKGPKAGRGKIPVSVQRTQYSLAQKEQRIGAKESPKMQTRSTKPGNQSPTADDGRSPVSVQDKEDSTANKEEYITAVKHQMASKDFKQRMKAIDKIVSDCREEPDLVEACIFPESPKTQMTSTASGNKGPKAGRGKIPVSVQRTQYSLAQKEQRIGARVQMESPKMQTRSTKPGNQSPTADDGRSPVSVQDKEDSTANKEEYITAMKHQMASKDFKQRMKAIDKIVSDCREEPDLVVACIFPIFDAIVERLRESNQKVNRRTLEALQVIIPSLKDSLAQVLNMLVPAIVENNLNSKMEVIRRLAVDALNSLIEHLDKCLLLTALSSKAQTQTGNAKGLLIDMLTGIVTDLYPRKPRLVERKVLPLLWKLLASSLNRGQTASLCHALYAQMGQRLSKCVLSQSTDVRKALNQILRMK